MADQGYDEAEETFQNYVNIYYLKKVQKQTLSNDNVKSKQDTTKFVVPVKTASEISFEKIRNERIDQRVVPKANKTHKQKVDDYNKYLDGLSEYHDIMKVSWTK
ncbi:hypothetical protein MXB_2728 [Myxobolus squamalis]|nr:hypothetical protein MXB_2728 [Myxobolus squamalis]